MFLLACRKDRSSSAQSQAGISQSQVDVAIDSNRSTGVDTFVGGYVKVGYRREAEDVTEKITGPVIFIVSRPSLKSVHVWSGTHVRSKYGDFDLMPDYTIVAGSAAPVRVGDFGQTILLRNDSVFFSWRYTAEMKNPAGGIGFYSEGYLWGKKQKL